MPVEVPSITMMRSASPFTGLALGLSQEEVAHRGGLALSDVGRIERQQRDPGVIVLTKLARGLGVTPAELLAGIR